MKRKAMSKMKDHRIFSSTALKTKKMNVSPKLSRGGIRL